MDLDCSRHARRRGEPAFRARQVWGWPAAGAASYEEMTDLPAALRERLADEVPFSSLQLEREAHARDGTVKALFATARRAPARGGADALPRRRPALGVPVLAVRVPADVHLLRDRPDALRAQPVRLGDPRPGAALPPPRADRPLRVHGHGRADAEPRRRARCLRAAAGPRRHPPAHDDLDRRLGARHPPLAECEMPVRLALSLHAPEDALRSELMPVNERYPLAEVLEACREFYARRRRRVFVEYVMLAGVNDRYEQALALARLLAPRATRARVQGQPDPLQPHRLAFRGSGRASIEAFRAALEERWRAGDGAAHARPRHRRRLRAARGRGGRLSASAGAGRRRAGPSPARPPRIRREPESRLIGSAGEHGQHDCPRRARAPRPSGLSCDSCEEIRAA